MKNLILVGFIFSVVLISGCADQSIQTDNGAMVDCPDGSKANTIDDCSTTDTSTIPFPEIPDDEKSPPNLPI